MSASPHARELATAAVLAVVGTAALATRIHFVGIDVPVGPDLIVWAGPLLGFPHFEDAFPPAFGALTRLAALAVGNLGDAGRLVSLLAAGALPGVAWLGARAWGLSRFSAGLLALLLMAAADVAVAGSLFQPDALGMFVLLGLIGAVGVVRAERPTYMFATVLVGGVLAMQVRELAAPVAAMCAAALACAGPRWLRGLVLLAILLVGPALVGLAPYLSEPLLEERALLPVADLLAPREQRAPLFLGVRDVWWPLGDARVSAALHARYGTFVHAAAPGDIGDAVALNARQALAIAGDVDVLLGAGLVGWLVALARRKERAAIVGVALLLPAAWSFLFWTQRRHHALFLAPALLGLMAGIDALAETASPNWRRFLRVVAVGVVAGIAVPQLSAGHGAQKLIAARLSTWPESPASARDLAAAGRAIAELASPGDALSGGPDSPQETLIPALVAGLPVVIGDCPQGGVTLWTPTATRRSGRGAWVVVEGVEPSVERCEGRAGAPPPNPATAAPPRPPPRGSTAPTVAEGPPR